MKVRPLGEVKAKFSAYIDECQTDLVLITRSGRPVAMLVPVDPDEDVEELALAWSPRLQQILEGAHRRMLQGNYLAEEELWSKLEASDAPRESPPRKSRASSPSPRTKNRRASTTPRSRQEPSPRRKPAADG